MAYGQSGHLAINFQDSFGTSNADSAHFVPLISESIAETVNQITEENMYARLAESPLREGTHEIGGDIRTEAHPIALGALLKASLGAVSTTPQDSAFLHEFLPVGSDWDDFAALPPMTLDIHRDAGSAFLYYDVLGSALALEIAHGNLLAASLSVVGGRFAQKGPGTPGFHAGKPWGWEVVSASYDGAGIADLRQISLTFDNQLASQFTLSAENVPRRIKREGPQTVQVEGTILFVDQTLFQEFRAQSEKRLLLTFAGETIAQSYQNLLTLDFPRLRFSEFAPQMAGPGQVEVGFRARGVFDTASGYALRVTLTNTQASY